MLPLTEMQIRYTRRDAKLIDYLVELPAGGKFAGAKVGVSVTRAMKYEPGPLQNVSRSIFTHWCGAQSGGAQTRTGTLSAFVAGDS